jgi:hypothetical protein
MFDAIDDSQFPLGLQAAAAYADGSLGNQPNYNFIVQAFPKAHHLAITLSSSLVIAVPDVALDIENGAASPQSAADWYAREKARGVERPVLYASAYTMETGVLPVIKEAGIPRAGVRLWSAHYGDGLHICGPASCGLMSEDADGTQWTSNAMGRPLDQSVLKDDFFGIPPLPPDWTYEAPRNLTATGGHESVRLAWDAPYGAPEPAEYKVWVYRGTLCNRTTLVPSYSPPRTADGTEWEGGGLELGRVYTAHVAASAADSVHVKPGVYASVIFKTG